MNGPSLVAQLPILPVVLPLLAGGLLVAAGRRGAPGAAALSFATLLAVLGCAAALTVRTADGSVLAYLAGNWPAPFGIALAVDRLSAAMVLVTALVAIACQLAAGDGLARRQPLFHALLQFQVAGLNGAFLTADLFNLFVFFEVLLIASYALLLAVADRGAVRAGVHYVAVNLFASALFLMAAALLYGVLGTLNMADLALRAAAVPGEDRALVEAAGLMLLLAFGIKAAALPLGFWLPGTYAAAPSPVAALFAIMTKVGLYAIARVGTLVFGDGGYAGVTGPLLLTVGLSTLGFAALAGLAARDLRGLAAWMIAGSAGTVLALLGVGTAASLGAAMFYLPHATFAAAALMLLAGLLAEARPTTLGDRFEAGPRPAAATLLGTLFLVCGLASAGLPPFSGFVAKAILLDAVRGAGATLPVWLVVLGASLAWVVALSRAGSRVFWKSTDTGDGTLATAAVTVPAAEAAAARPAPPIPRYAPARSRASHCSRPRASPSLCSPALWPVTSRRRAPSWSRRSTTARPCSDSSPCAARWSMRRVRAPVRGSPMRPGRLAPLGGLVVSSPGWRSTARRAAATWPSPCCSRSPVPLLLGGLWPRDLVVRRPGLALRLLLTLLGDIVVANLQVAARILGPEAALRPRFIWMPLALRNRYAVSTFAAMITLTPGTLSADVSADGRWLLVHALDVDDEAATVAGIKRRYEQPLAEILP